MTCSCYHQRILLPAITWCVLLCKYHSKDENHENLSRTTILEIGSFRDKCCLHVPRKKILSVVRWSHSLANDRGLWLWTTLSCILSKEKGQEVWTKDGITLRLRSTHSRARLARLRSSYDGVDSTKKSAGLFRETSFENKCQAFVWFRFFLKVKAPFVERNRTSKIPSFQRV